MSDYDRPSAPPHILANALSDPIDLPPGRGRAAKSARVSAPGPEPQEPSNLADAFPREQRRCRKLLQVYRELPGVVGAFAAMMLERDLTEAEQAAMSGDLVRMIRAYGALRGFK